MNKNLAQTVDWLSELTENSTPGYTLKEPYITCTEYLLSKPFSMDYVDSVIQSSPDTRLFYKSQPSLQTNYKTTLCCYLQPKGKTMYKANMQVEANDCIKRIFITVFTSIDIMRDVMIQEVEDLQKTKPDRITKMPLRQFLLDVFA